MILSTHLIVYMYVVYEILPPVIKRGLSLNGEKKRDKVEK